MLHVTKEFYQINLPQPGQRVSKPFSNPIPIEYESQALATQPWRYEDRNKA